MRKSGMKSAKGAGVSKGTAVRTTMKPVFGKRSVGKRGGRGR